MARNHFDALVDELSELYEQRNSRAEMAALLADLPRKAAQSRATFNKALGELDAINKTMRKEERERRQRDAQERRERLSSLGQRATAMYKAGTISGDELVRFEVIWNRAMAQMKLPANGDAQ